MKQRGSILASARKNSVRQTNAPRLSPQEVSWFFKDRMPW